MTKKNLIVGILVSLNYRDIEPFIVSLQKNCPPCELLVHVSASISDWTLDCIKKTGGAHNVSIERIPPELGGKYFGYMRFKMIEDHLAAHEGEYDQVLMSDMRDVIIQGDPFAAYAEYDSYLSYHPEPTTIGEAKHHTDWMIRNFGREVWQQIKDCPTACGGTLMGTADAMRVALHEINKYIVEDRFNNLGADQSTLNYLIHTGRMPVKKLIESNIYGGAVCTNGLKETPINDRFILNLSGEVPAVVHQYDRHPKQVALVDRLYRQKDFRVEKRYDDLKSKLDLADAMFRGGRFSESLMYLSELAELDTPEWKTRKDRGLRLARTLNSVTLPEISSAWITQAVCQIFIRLLRHNAITNMTAREFDGLHQMSLSSRKQLDANAKTFDAQLSTMALQFAHMFDQKNVRVAVSKYLEMIKQLDCPLSREYWLLSAKNNRLLGHKEQALEDYKKVIE